MWALGVHALVVALAFFARPKPKMPPPALVRVTTISLKPPTPPKQAPPAKAAHSSKEEAPKQPAPAKGANPPKKAPPLQQKKTVERPSHAGSSKKGKAAPKKVAPTVKKSAKGASVPSKKGGSASQKKPSSSQTSPQALPQNTEVRAFPLPMDFQQLLASKLKEQLELPEIGTVELKIFFGAKGSIDKIEVLHAKSQKNRDYLLKALKKIELPALPSGFRGSLEPLIVEFDNNS